MSPIPAPPPIPAEVLAPFAGRLGLSPPLAEVLWRRGLRDPDEAWRWLEAGPEGLHDPSMMPGMDEAVRRLRAALGARERILIHGDYDVDGLTGTVLLVRLLRFLDADVAWHVPERADGYSFSEASIRRIRDEGFRLCISVDNGTSAREEIARIQALGCDVIVTDHHERDGEPAPARCLLNPKLGGYPFPYLAGVGVAFKLAWALGSSFSRHRILSEEFRSFLADAVALVALGTVADVVPLTGENRILVRMGLQALGQTRHPGLAALLDVLGPSRRALAADDLSFRLGPRLNAAGRMGRAATALRLLTADSYGEARRLADELERMNRRRQRIESDTLEQAEAFLAAHPDLAAAPILLAWGEGWHLGVVGIVAARLVDRYGKPALVLSVESGLARGSGRSPAGIDLHATLEPLRPRMLSFGGHARAIGLSLDAGKIEEFAACLAAARPRQTAFHRPAHRAEAVVPLTHWTSAELKRLARFRPFGEGNPPPSFLTDGVRFGRNLRRLGPGGRGLSGTVIQAGMARPFHAPSLGPRIAEILERPAGWRILYTPAFGARPETGAIQLKLQAAEPLENGAGRAGGAAAR